MHHFSVFSIRFTLNEDDFQGGMSSLDNLKLITKDEFRQLDRLKVVLNSCLNIGFIKQKQNIVAMSHTQMKGSFCHSRSKS